MQPGDKVRVIDGYYQGQEGHIEGIKECEFIVALQNDYGCVNTVLPEKRLEIIEQVIYVMDKKTKDAIRRAIISTIKGVEVIFHADNKLQERRNDCVNLLKFILSCIDCMEKNN